MVRESCQLVPANGFADSIPERDIKMGLSSSQMQGPAHTEVQSQSPGILRHLSILPPWHCVFRGPLAHLHSMRPQLKYQREHRSSSEGSAGLEKKREEPGDLQKTLWWRQQYTQYSPWDMLGDMHFREYNGTQKHQNLKQAHQKEMVTAQKSSISYHNRKAGCNRGIHKWRDVSYLLG